MKFVFPLMMVFLAFIAGSMGLIGSVQSASAEKEILRSSADYDRGPRTVMADGPEHFVATSQAPRVDPPYRGNVTPTNGQFQNNPLNQSPCQGRQCQQSVQPDWQSYGGWGRRGRRW